MQKFERKAVYKTRDPFDTINCIREILFDADIFLTEQSYRHKESNTNASILRFGDTEFVNSNISTNGKGMDARYSLASAYAEMMERLENGILLIKYREKAFADGEIEFLSSPDEKWIYIKDFSPECRKVICKILKLSPEKYEALISEFINQKLCCVPYRNVLSDKTVYLPYHLLTYSIGSNGMCAGNTEHEAIAQGVSEIFERASLAAIYGKNPAVKLLHKESFEGTRIKQKLDYLEEQGISVKIVDASLGLNYPVVGLVLGFEEGTITNLGADPNPVVALERCLTEQFQCVGDGKYKLRISSGHCGKLSDWKLEAAAEWYHDQFASSRRFGSGMCPENLYNIDEVYSENYVYNSEGKDDYDYIVSLVEKLDYELYVRDYSYMGFPAYSVLIPEISLGDYTAEPAISRISGALTASIPTEEIPENEYKKAVSILRYMEQKQKEYAAY